ncbi:MULTISPECIES: glutathione S-transferase C-terminal domain-containing protein [unclassified Streptomyces]|uniref:glutathione S-transferase C-terminal domain-containing protein n=1 Tax=unclassified Streptomyces TaxID=2593676 RepID=UPI00278BF8AA|nr:MULTISPECIES: glutathione S-transferase C-terminal domain-containing protein [unclassified Streptomyces]
MSATAPTAAVPSFRSRIGCDARSGYYAAPHRYRLHLSPSCPHCLQIAVTHTLLGLDDTLPVTVLPAAPDTPGGGHRALLPLYEATSHQHPGPPLAPVLSDDWTGRIVSSHPGDILHDLARHFGGHGPDLLPHGAEGAIAAVGRLCERGITLAARRGDAIGRATPHRALTVLDRRLAGREYVLHGQLTLADIRLWSTLVHPNLADHVATHPRLSTYVRRLSAHPAFAPHLARYSLALA